MDKHSSEAIFEEENDMEITRRSSFDRKDDDYEYPDPFGFSLTDLTKKVKNFKENEMDESEELESERTSSVSMEIHTDGAPEYLLEEEVDDDDYDDDEVRDDEEEEDDFDDDDCYRSKSPME